MAAPLEPGENQILLNGRLYNLNIKRSPQDIVRQDLQTFPAPATIGPADFNTDPVLSAFVIHDLSGGIGIEDITGADTTRYRWGNADVRSPGAFTLGPRVVQTRPTADDTDDLFPLGIIPGTNPEFYVAVLESAGLVNLYAWNESTDAWRAASLDIDGHPTQKPTVFQGTNANAYMWINRGAGATTSIAVRTTGAGTLGTLAAVTEDFSKTAVWDGRIWGITGSGATLFELYSSFDMDTWTAVTDPRTGNTLTLGQDQEPVAMLPWYNLAGESTLYAVTSGDDGTASALYAFNPDKGAWETVYEIPPHTVKYRPATVWRPSEDLWLGIGGSIIRRTPAGVTVPLAGPGADGDGLPSGFLGTVRDLCPEFNGLYCQLQNDGTGSVANANSVLVYTGSGWHPIWLGSTPAGNANTIMSAGLVGGVYRLWWGDGSYAYTVKLRQGPWSPRQGYTNGIDEFESTSYFETGRFWGQTQGFYKLAHRMEVFMDHATSTEKVTVQYQTDAVTAWTTLGEVTTGRDTVPASPFTTLSFGTADSLGVYPGIRFNWIKFKFVFARGSTVTNTPVMAAAVLHYVKLRDSTPSITIDLDFTETDLGGRTPGQQKAELRALANGASQFYTLREGMNVYGVVVASFVDYGGSGADQRGNGALSIVAVQTVSQVS